MSKDKYKINQLKDRERILDKRIMDIFLSVGISSHLQGYHYLKESVKIVMNDPNSINSVTKKVYPAVAEKFETTACRVERGIRHALEVSYAKGKMIHLNKIFGIEVLTQNEKPTNSEFVALLADKLSLERRY